MSVVPYDKELEALEEEERQLDLEIAKQEKLQQIAEKNKQLQELSATGNPAAAMPTVTRTATITVKKGTYHEHSESRTTQKSAGLSAKLMKDMEIGYKEESMKGTQVQWKRSEEVEGSMPINLDQPSGGPGSVEPTQAFLAAMGISAEQIKALKDK